jgi:predicted PhzF superfamily epimerase YddE/YHI9
MVRNGVAQPNEQVLIEQGAEVRRLSRIFVRAGKRGETVENVRVGGYCAEVMRGEVVLQ